MSLSTQALARFAIETYVLARPAKDPAAAVDEVFDRLTNGWSQASSANSPLSAWVLREKFRAGHPAR